MLCQGLKKVFGLSIPLAASFAVKQFAITGVGKVDGNSQLILGSNKAVYDIGSPLEVLLTALAGCENTTSRQYCKEHKLQMKNMNFTKVAAKYNTDGFLGKPVDKNIFSEVEIEVEVESNMKENEFEKMHHEIMKRCPIYQILERSGTVMKQKFIQKKY